MAKDFNQTVALDLKIWPKFNKIISYIVDCYTRYTQAHIIEDKKPESVIEKFLEGWIFNLFGAPESVVIDNGGEFYNSKFKDICQNLNIKIKATSAQSPYQNGLCERNHAITDNIVEKMMMDDPEIPFSRALKAATFAKNALINVSGFSPSQLVFGKQPQLPSVMSNQLPAQECLSSVKIYTDRVNAIFTARKIFSEIENSNRLNRALKAKIIPKMEHYETGDEVFYRRKDDHIWQGPGKVIGFDGKTIIIKHGRFTYSVSQSHLIKTRSGLDAPKDLSATDKECNENLNSADSDSSDDDVDQHLEQEDQTIAETEETVENQPIIPVQIDESINILNQSPNQSAIQVPNKNPKIYPKRGQHIFVKVQKPGLTC